MAAEKKLLKNPVLPLKNQPVFKQANKETETLPLQNNQMKEIKGPQGPEPTRYGDWQQKGRCSDF